MSGTVLVPGDPARRARGPAAHGGSRSSKPVAAAVGATWVVDGAWPQGEWVAELRDLINAGPRR